MSIKKFLILFASSFMAVPMAFADGESDDELTVISYNIRMGAGKDGTNSWEYRYAASAMMIMDQKPDIFGLQEAFDYQMEYMDDYCDGYKCIGVGREVKAQGRAYGHLLQEKHSKTSQMGNILAVRDS